ncbi:MAG: PadR family transcriptional regulator [Candidatus Thorarchaeota archaeon]|jgi:DNA-binding PadR family transcriptional regulator
MSLKSKAREEPSAEMSEILSDFSQFYIVLLLNEGPIHGYGVMRAFKNRTGSTLSAGTLYPFLQKLESMGLVKKAEKSTGNRPKIVYTLTRKGRGFTNRLFRRFSAMTASALEPSLETCASCGARVYDGAHHEEVDGIKLGFCCVHCAKAYKNDLVPSHGIGNKQE